ncbi:hypothetical protein ACFPK9_14705 [Rubritalea spongiae]|uniref:Uncharacterized protein n=1 Tax=Rubritalea spongiae TaxID=430797 RepID=A0ABW5DXL0_9BACT
MNKHADENRNAPILVFLPSSPAPPYGASSPTLDTLLQEHAIAISQLI